MKMYHAHLKLMLKQHHGLRDRLANEVVGILLNYCGCLGIKVNVS